MRLGELRTIIRDFDNKLEIKLSCYDERLQKIIKIANGDLE